MKTQETLLTFVRSGQVRYRHERVLSRIDNPARFTTQTHTHPDTHANTCIREGREHHVIQSTRSMQCVRHNISIIRSNNAQNRRPTRPPCSQQTDSAKPQSTHSQTVVICACLRKHGYVVFTAALTCMPRKKVARRESWLDFLCLAENI